MRRLDFIASIYKHLDPSALPLATVSFQSSSAIDHVAEWDAGRKLGEKFGKNIPGIDPNKMDIKRNVTDPNVLRHAGFVGYRGWFDVTNHVYVLTCHAEDAIKKILDPHVAASIACSQSIENTAKAAAQPPEEMVHQYKPFVIFDANETPNSRYRGFASARHYLDHLEDPRCVIPVLCRPNAAECLAATKRYCQQHPTEYRGYAVDATDPSYSEAEVEALNRAAVELANSIAAQHQADTISPQMEAAHKAIVTTSTTSPQPIITPGLLGFKLVVPRLVISKESNARLSELINELAADPCCQPATDAKATNQWDDKTTDEIVASLRDLSAKLHADSGKEVRTVVKVGADTLINRTTIAANLPKKEAYIVRPGRTPSWLRPIAPVVVKAFSADQAIAKAMKVWEKAKAIPPVYQQKEADHDKVSQKAITLYDVAGDGLYVKANKC